MFEKKKLSVPKIKIVLKESIVTDKSIKNSRYLFLINRSVIIVGFSTKPVESCGENYITLKKRMFGHDRSF